MYAISLNTFFREHSTVGKHEMYKFEAWRARLGGVPRDRQLVPWLKNIPAKAGFGQAVRIAKFGAPMYHLTLVVRHVDQKAAMGIGPKPFRHGSLQRDLFVPHVSNTRSVVRQQRDSYDDKGRNQGKRRNELTLHVTPPR